MRRKIDLAVDWWGVFGVGCILASASSLLVTAWTLRRAAEVLR